LRTIWLCNDSTGESEKATIEKKRKGEEKEKFRKRYTKFQIPLRRRICVISAGTNDYRM
jgi:hypothetical protein